MCWREDCPSEHRRGDWNICPDGAVIARDEFTRSYLSQILQITGGNVSQAARHAKRNRTDFYKLLGRHQLVPDDFKGK